VTAVYNFSASKRYLLLSQTTVAFQHHPAFEATLALIEAGECVWHALALTGGGQCHCARCYKSPTYRVEPMARAISVLRSGANALVDDAPNDWKWAHNSAYDGNRWTRPVKALAGGMAAWNGEIFATVDAARSALAYAALDFAGYAP
jgi:hypothetical protein